MHQEMLPIKSTYIWELLSNRAVQFLRPSFSETVHFYLRDSRSKWPFIFNFENIPQKWPFFFLDCPLVTERQVFFKKIWHNTIEIEFWWLNLIRIMLFLQPSKMKTNLSTKMKLSIESNKRILFVLTFILTMGIATSQIYLMQKFNKEIMLPKLLQRKYLELIFYNWMVPKVARFQRQYHGL